MRSQRASLFCFKIQEKEGLTMELQVFENSEFGKVRTVMLDGIPWLVGRDVAKALGYAKPENAIAIHVESDDKTTTLIQGSGSNYTSKTLIINKIGVYVNNGTSNATFCSKL